MHTAFRPHQSIIDFFGDTSSLDSENEPNIDRFSRLIFESHNALSNHLVNEYHFNKQQHKLDQLLLKVSIHPQPETTDFSSILRYLHTSNEFV